MRISDSLEKHLSKSKRRFTLGQNLWSPQWSGWTKYFLFRNRGYLSRKSSHALNHIIEVFTLALLGDLRLGLVAAIFLAVRLITTSQKESTVLRLRSYLLSGHQILPLGRWVLHGWSALQIVIFGGLIVQAQLSHGVEGLGLIYLGAKMIEALLSNVFQNFSFEKTLGARPQISPWLNPCIILSTLLVAMAAFNSGGQSGLVILILGLFLVHFLEQLYVFRQEMKIETRNRAPVPNHGPDLTMAHLLKDWPFFLSMTAKIMFTMALVFSPAIDTAYMLLVSMAVVFESVASSTLERMIRFASVDLYRLRQLELWHQQSRLVNRGLAFGAGISIILGVVFFRLSHDYATLGILFSFWIVSSGLFRLSFMAANLLDALSHSFGRLAGFALLCCAGLLLLSPNLAVPLICSTILNFYLSFYLLKQMFSPVFTHHLAQRHINPNLSLAQKVIRPAPFFQALELMPLKHVKNNWINIRLDERWSSLEQLKTELGRVSEKLEQPHYFIIKNRLQILAFFPQAISPNITPILQKLFLEHLQTMISRTQKQNIFEALDCPDTETKPVHIQNQELLATQLELTLIQKVPAARDQIKVWYFSQDFLWTSLQGSANPSRQKLLSRLQSKALFSWELNRNLKYKCRSSLGTYFPLKPFGRVVAVIEVPQFLTPQVGPHISQLEQGLKHQMLTHLTLGQTQASPTGKHLAQKIVEKQSSAA